MLIHTGGISELRNGVPSLLLRFVILDLRLAGWWGLFDARKTCLGLGILMGVNDGCVVIFTPVTGDVSEIKLARVKPDL